MLITQRSIAGFDIMHLKWKNACDISGNRPRDIIGELMRPTFKDGVFELRFAFGSGYRIYFGEDGDNAALLSQLRVIARVKGISAIADEVGITRQGLQKALSSKGNPRLDNINSIMHAMGYSLMPQKMEIHAE